MEIILENIRCFAGQHRIPVRPLTLLVGENSAGKSTFLAVVSCILNALDFPSQPGFNDSPYGLGNFDTIAHRCSRFETSDTFSMGFAALENNRGTQRQVLATYKSDFGNVDMCRVHIACSDGTLELEVSHPKVKVNVVFAKKGGRSSNPLFFEHQLGELPLMLILEPTFLVSAFRKKNVNGSHQQRDRIARVLNAGEPPYRHCFSFAPIRSKPKRTYDEFTESFDPEGEHVPFWLAKLFKESPAASETRRLQNALVGFGKDSGLFKKVGIRKLGKKSGDPFQVEVSVAGAPANLTDVGYGVSQALPVVVQSVLETSKKVLLLQQPEVHLHPRAQAALGTFFTELASTDRMFLIETHSDHLVDRVRQEVAKGSISSDRVLILFFDKPKRETTVHPITIDDNGNVDGAPESYRAFFLEEEINLLSRTGH